MIKNFDPNLVKDLYKTTSDISKRENGQVTIIGGSSLFHGAPLLSLKTASRISGMVYFSSPEKSVGEVASKLKSKLFSFIWVPWEEVGEYIKKSDSVLIGPGFMRYRSEKEGDNGLSNISSLETQRITKELLTKYSNKKWVIDAGSLQMLKKEWIPENAILTSNEKEYKILFGNEKIEDMAKKYNCIICRKANVATICSKERCYKVSEPVNPGMMKGGMGDVQAGLTVSLLAKNEPLLSSVSALYIGRMAAQELYKTKGAFFNADDFSDKVPEVFKSLL
jgi:NAD(P)H-hydrate epimerase